MEDEYRIIKLSFHINIKTHSEWHFLNFGREKYSKNMSFVDLQQLQLKNVALLIKTNFDWWKALENHNFLLMLKQFHEKCAVFLGYFP